MASRAGPSQASLLRHNQSSGNRAVCTDVFSVPGLYMYRCLLRWHSHAVVHGDSVGSTSFRLQHAKPCCLSFEEHGVWPQHQPGDDGSRLAVSAPLERSCVEADSCRIDVNRLESDECSIHHPSMKCCPWCVDHGIYPTRLSPMNGDYSPW